MRGCRWALGVCIAGTILPQALLAAQSPEKQFQDLFGPEARKVSQTASKLDDVAFAQKLLTSAKTLSDAPALRVYLYEKAYEFGIRSAKGYSSARQALDLLDHYSPRRKDLWQEKRLELYGLEYRFSTGTKRKQTGEKYVTQLLIVGDVKAKANRWDEAAALYQRAVSTATYLRSAQKASAVKKLATAELMKQAEGLKARLKEDPQNTVVRMTLIRLFVTDLDDPNGARPFLDATVDETWRTYVPLAARKPSALAAQVCLELGNWYKMLTSSVGPTAKSRPVLARHARAYYRLYLRRAPGEGVPPQTVEQARERINLALKAIGEAQLPRQITFDVPAVQKAFDKAVAYLWSRRAAAGNWPYGGGSSYASQYSVGVTSAAAWALLEAGVPVSDPRMVKALRWLERHSTPYTSGTSLRACLWRTVEQQEPGKGRALLQRDVKALLIATTTGSYGLRVHRGYATGYAYNTYSWLGQMGVGAGAEIKLRISRKYWTACLEYWTKQQKADGGWCYRPGSGARSYSESNMLWTSTGAANVAMCLENLHGAYAMRQMSGRDFEPLKKALAWLDKNVAVTMEQSSVHGGTTYHALYNLSRLGRTLGREKFGKTDWFQQGSSHLASTQSETGAWGRGIEDTAFAVLFLVNGQKMQGRKPRPGATPPAARDHPARRAALKRVRALIDRLKADPTSKPIAQEIVRVYLLELREPVSAAAYAAATGDDTLIRIVPLAAKDPAKLTEGQCLQLAEWYAAQAGDDSPTARTNALLLGETYYKRFLELHTTGDAERLKAELALGKIQKALAALKKRP